MTHLNGMYTCVALCGIDCFVEYSLALAHDMTGRTTGIIVHL